MATLLVVRVLPDPPMDAGTFSRALKNLTITAWDRSVNNTSTDPVVGANDFKLGTASGVANLDQSVDLNIIPGIDGGPPSFDFSIIQHWQNDPQIDPFGLPLPKAVATALIVVNTPPAYQEYPGPTASGSRFFDVRFEVVRDGINIPSLTIGYNIKSVFVPLPLPTKQADWTSHLSATSVDYVFPTSAYISIPPPPAGEIQTDAAFLNLGRAGQPPNFGPLAAAIDKVLALDSPVTARSLNALTEPLTKAQCEEIASEIVYNRIIDPPPEPGGNLEELYTVPDNKKSPPDSGQGQTWVSRYILFLRSKLGFQSRIGPPHNLHQGNPEE